MEKVYIIKYENDLVCVTNNPKEWLKYNNKQRKADGQELESLEIFSITETELNIY